MRLLASSMKRICTWTRCRSATGVLLPAASTAPTSSVYEPGGSTSRSRCPNHEKLPIAGMAVRAQDALAVEVEIHVRALAELVVDPHEVGLMVAVGREGVAVRSSPS